MADTKTDSPSTPLSDDPANPTKGLSAKRTTASHPAGAEPGLDTLFHRTKGLSAKRTTASHPAGAEPGLDTLFHRTSLRFCCAG